MPWRRPVAYLGNEGPYQLPSHMHTHGFGGLTRLPRTHRPLAFDNLIDSLTHFKRRRPLACFDGLISRDFSIHTLSFQYTGDYYDRFLSKTLKHSTITVALMVPDPSGKTDMVRQVRCLTLATLHMSLCSV